MPWLASRSTSKLNFLFLIVRNMRFLRFSFATYLVPHPLLPFRTSFQTFALLYLLAPAQLNDVVLSSAVGTGGPVIYVDGKPSNVDHAWVKHDEVRDKTHWERGVALNIAG